MFFSFKNCSKLYTQGQYNGKFREYFYYISHEGFLFLDDARLKVFTSAYRDTVFLDFFFKNLRQNETERYKDTFPYLSLCGRERNYLRADDRPIAIVEDGTRLKIGNSNTTIEFQPQELAMLSNGRLYHPSQFGTYGLVKSALADTLFPFIKFDATGYPQIFTWKGTKYEISNKIRKTVDPDSFK